MTDNSPQNVSVQVEADATQAVTSINKVVNELGGIIGKVAQLEASLKRMLGDQLPANLEKTGAKLKYLQEVAKTASLISKGAPDVQLKSAAFAAERSKIQADGVLQKIKLEKELNKVIEARGEIYKRSQAQLPTNVSERSGVKAYRDNLSTIVPPPKGKAELRAWQEETLNQYRYFNQKQIAEEAAAAAKLEAHRQKLADNKARREKERQDRDAANAQTNQEKLNLQARTQLVIDEKNDREAAQKKADREAKKAATAAKAAADQDKADQESIEQRNTKARLMLAVDEKNDKEAAQKKAERDAKAAATAAKVAADKELAAAKAQERWMSKNYSKLFKMDPVERETQVQAALDKLEAHAARRGITGFDRARAYGNYQDEMAARSLVPAPPPKTHADKVAQGYQNTHDRFNYRGGAGMFEIQGDILRNYATMGAVLGTVGFAARSTIEFESAMKDVQAVSAATNLELKGLTKTVFEVANTAKFSSKEVAEGAKSLAQAGYSVQQIGEMLQPIANLATGSGSSLADAAATTTSILSVFDLSVGRTAEVTNTLTAGLNQSKLSMEQLSLGIQYAGNIVADGGVQFEELVSALGAMSNAGIKSGSTLGTGLRALIQDLESPSKKFVERLTAMGLTAEDVNVKTHGLAEVMQTLKTAGFDSASAMGSFEVRAAAAYSALSNNLNVFDKLQQNIVGTAAATAAAGVQMDSFSAQWQRLTNSVTQLTYVAGAPLLGTFQVFTGLVADLFGWMSKSTVAVQTLGTVLGSLITAATIKWTVGLVAGLLGIEKGAVAATFALNAQTLSFRRLTAAAIATSRAMLMTPIGWMTVGFTALAVATSFLTGRQDALNAKIDQFATAANEAGAKSEDYANRVRELEKYTGMLTARSESLGKSTLTVGQEAERASVKFGAWGLQLGDNIKTIDQLIGKTVQLRGEMARLGAQQAEVRVNELGQQQTQQERQLSNNWNRVKSYWTGGVPNISGASAAARGVLEEMRRQGDNPPDARTALRWQSTLSEEANRLPRDSSIAKALQTQVNRLAPVTKSAGDIATTTGQIAQAQATAGTLSVVSGSTALTSQAARWGRDYTTRQVAAYDLKDPKAKAEALASNRAGARKGYAEMEGQAAIEAARIYEANPQAARMADAEAARTGMTPQGVIMSQLMQNPDVAKVRNIAGMVDYSATKRDLQARLQANVAQVADAKKWKRPKSEIQDLMREQGDLQNAIREKTLTEDGFNVDEYGNVMASQAVTNAAREHAALAPDRSRSGGQSKAANNKVKALERLIEQAMAQAGPDAAGIKAAQPKLKGLLGEWTTAKRAADPATSLEDFNILAQEYTDKVLNGNLQAAADLLAKEAQRAADLKTQSNASGVSRGTMDVQQSIEDVVVAYNDAATKAIAALDQSFKAAEGDTFDPSISADALQKRRDIMEKMVSDTMEAVNAQIAALAERQNRELAAAQLVIDDERAKIAMLSNSWGNHNISDVQRYLGGLAGQKLDVREQQLDVQSKRDAASNAQLRLDTQNALAWKTPADGKMTDDFNKARADLEAAQVALQKSELNLKAMTGEAAPFATLSEAIRGSWAAYADQANLAKPALAQIADGLTGVFETTRGSFKTLITDVVTGSKTMGDAMKDFTLSVLQSFLDMAAQMLANAALKWVVTTIASMWGNGSVDASNPLVNVFQGGEIPKKYAQGGPAPFRDSVHAMLQPGEIVMRRSAVDFIGRENLLDMNNMGNRRVSQMPTVASSRREPDNVNVWVVAPETKPQIGKSDILATISQDIMTGGRTKQLIKAVQMGAA